jgi:2-polyprenyl-3-methyl-5-hydroxy-6-metoxy-1,4-benzoquinol methylase
MQKKIEEENNFQTNQTVEPQYNILFRVKEKHGVSRLGLMINESWNEDPRRSLFTLSRYKFVSKMLEGRTNVLEVGCADAFGTRLVQQTVKKIVAVDIDPIFVNDAKSRMNANWKFDIFQHNILEKPVQGEFDGVYALDVLEHIEMASERKFIENIMHSMTEDGVFICGMPSINSQLYASPQSKIGHVNCKTGEALRDLFKDYFNSVFVFSMNDEVVHTGFFPMANYLLCLACHRK